MSAIAFDAAIDGGFASAASLTYSFTVGSHSNRYLLVGAVGDTSAAAADYSATYGGIAMSLIQKVLSNAGGCTRNIYMFGLANPATGANNVVVSTNGGTLYIESQVSSYYNVNPNIDHKSTSVSGASATFAISNTPVADNCWVVAFAASMTGAAPTAGSGTTVRAFEGNGGSAIGDGNGLIHPPASTTLNFANGGGAGWSGAIVSLAPFIGGGLLSWDGRTRASVL